VPLVLLERSWWAGFNGILFGKIWIQNVGDIDFKKWFLPTENSNQFQQSTLVLHEVSQCWLLKCYFGGRMVVELGSSSPLSPSNLKRFGLLLFIGFFYLSIFTNSFYFVFFVNKHHCIITLLPPLWHVRTSNQQQVKIGNVPCMKFHKYELTIHTNTWYTFLGYVEPNEKWHHFPVWYSLHYVEERAPLFWQNLSTLFSGGTQVRCNARHQFLLYQWDGCSSR
jgi:hypothetical protein